MKFNPPFRYYSAGFRGTHHRMSAARNSVIRKFLLTSVERKVFFAYGSRPYLYVAYIGHHLLILYGTVYGDEHKHLLGLEFHETRRNEKPHFNQGRKKCVSVLATFVARLG